MDKASFQIAPLDTQQFEDLDYTYTPDADVPAMVLTSIKNRHANKNRKPVEKNHCCRGHGAGSVLSYLRVPVLRPRMGVRRVVRVHAQPNSNCRRS